MDFKIKGVTPDICSPYGGCDFTLTGSGLAVSNSEALSVEIDGIEAEITDASNTEIVFKLPTTSHIVRVNNDGVQKGKKKEYDHIYLHTNYTIIKLYNKFIHIFAYEKRFAVW